MSINEYIVAPRDSGHQRRFSGEEQFENEMFASEEKAAMTEFHLSVAMSAVSPDLSDLPIHFHKEIVDMWSKRHSNKLLRTSTAMAVEIPTSPSDVKNLFVGKRRSSTESAEEDDSTRRSKFRNLDPDTFLKRLSEQKKFLFVRDLAIIKLYAEIKKKLEICIMGIGCQENEELPHRIFSWIRADFLERRQLMSSVWVDLIIKNISEICLGKKKMKRDLEAFMQFVELILDGSLDKTLSKFEIEILGAVEDAHDFLRIEEALSQELADNCRQVRKYLNKQIELKLSKHCNSSRAGLFADIEERRVRTDVVDPIEIRYQIRYFAAAEEGIIHRLTSTEVSLQKELVRIQRQVESESYVSQCILNTYYMSVERYKAEIAAFTEKYHMEYESLEAEISNKKLSIEKIRQQIIFFTEQIQRFHEEFEDLRLEQIEQQLQEERCKREEEAMRLERNQRSAERSKSKKKKKSKK